MERLSWQERVKKSEHPSPRGFFPIKERALLHDFQGEADGLNPTGQQQSTDDSEVGDDFWRISRNYIYRHHVQPMVKLYVPKEGSFPTPLKYIDVVRWTFFDARIVTSLRKLIPNSNFRVRTGFFVEDNFFLLNEHFLMTGTHETRLNVNDLINVQLRGDDVQGFDTMWDDVFLSIQEVPPDSILESFFRTQLTKSDQLRNVLAMYDMELVQHESKPSYQRSKTWWKRSWIRSRRLVISWPDMKEPSQEHPQKAKAGRNQSALSVNKENATDGRQKEYVAEVKRGASPRSSSPAPNSQTSNHWKNALRSKQPTGSSPSGKGSQRPCRDFLAGNCTNPSYDSWHPPECFHYKSQSGCTFGDNCSFFHREADRQSKTEKGWRIAKNWGCVF